MLRILQSMYRVFYPIHRALQPKLPLGFGPTFETDCSILFIEPYSLNHPSGFGPTFETATNQ
ncbi:unnamed protein product [Ilex paraguariensis]|uniref:Uncharacterized protein n=1 Tax=Ilex paraguariensis TaxID=185542 RepID=A0ABC8RYW5_9AQUA